MQVSQLFIYPVKSLGGIELQRSRITERGLEYDRRYMLVDENNQFITQRSHPLLALIKTAIAQDGFRLSYHDKQIVLPFFITGEITNVTVWDDEVEAVIASEKYNAWFSQILNENIRLVYMPDKSERAVDKKYADENDVVSFADGYPVLMISEESLELLNSKLAEPIGMDRFRPNIVIKGVKPHEEDLILEFSISTVKFRGVKPCARCIITTINQQTLSRSKEPLATLSGYRNHQNKILFGQNVISKSTGDISVLDELLVFEMK